MTYIMRKTLLAIIIIYLGLGQVWARTYSGGELLYVRNYRPSEWGSGTDNWKQSGGEFWATFDASATQVKPSRLEPTGDWNDVGTVYCFVVPDGEHTTVTLHRGDKYENPTWSGKTNAITLDATKNYIYDGYNTDASTANWQDLPMFSNGSTMYLIRGWNWSQSNERYAAYFFDGVNSEWVDLTNHSGDIFKCTIPTRKWAYMIMCRMNGSQSANNWGNKWMQTQNIAPSGTGNCVYITGNDPNDGTATSNWRLGKYAATPAITGGMNDWSPVANQFSGSPLQLTMSLSAGKAYQFKVALGEDNSWYGRNNTYDNDLVFVGQTGAKTLYSGEHNMMMMTAEAGTYTFEWNSDDHKLTITYPSAGNHPSANYYYITKNASSTRGWNSGNYIYLNFWNGSGPLGEWASTEPKLEDSVEINDVYYYYVPVLTDYTSFKAHEKKDGSSGYTTGDQTLAGHTGQFIDCVESVWGWDDFTFTVTLNPNSGDIADGHDVTSYTFGKGATLPNSDYITRTGYTFGGWYNNAGFEGSAIEEISTTDNGDKTYYAKWTPITYSITYDVDDGTMFFADTQTSYNIESSTITLHAAAKSGYVFAGWYSDEELETPASTIPTGSTGDKTFYAKWTEQGCLGEHVAGTVFIMLPEKGPSDAVNLTAGNYVDLNGTHATFTRGTGVYGTTASDARITEAANSSTRRRLKMSSTSHVVTLNLSCPLVAYDTIIIYDSHRADDKATGTFEFSITNSPLYSNTNSTSGATASSGNDTTKYVVPIGSELIGVTPIYVWGSASSDLHIRRIDIHRTNTWRLTYDGNGTSSMTPTNVPAAEYRPASPVALSNTVPVLGDYTFAGWNTATDGSGTNYASGDDYTIPSASTTLYAKWTLAVTLDDNGGTGGSTSVTMTHKSATHSAIMLPTRAGYEFTGYYDAASDGRRVTDETGALLASVGSYTSSDRTWKYGTSGLTLYAHWKFVIYRTGDAPDGGAETFAGGDIDWPIEYRMKVHTLDQWYSLYLPFDVDAIKVIEDGVYYDIQPYYRPEVGGTLYQGHYFIRTPAKTSDFPIKDFSDWRDPESYVFTPSGNTPYVIRWHDSYFLNKYIAFFGHTDDAIPTSMTADDRPTKDSVVNVYGNDAMVSGTVEDGYTLEADYGQGAWLREETIGASRTVLPFECYLRANAKTTPIFKALRRTDIATGTPVTDAPSLSTDKMVINGQVVIIRDNKMYNVLGMEIQ